MNVTPARCRCQAVGGREFVPVGNGAPNVGTVLHHRGQRLGEWRPWLGVPVALLTPPAGPPRPELPLGPPCAAVSVTAEVVGETKVWENLSGIADLGNDARVSFLSYGSRFWIFRFRV